MTLLLLPFVVLAHAFMPGKVMSPADNIFGLRPWNTIYPGVSSTNPLLLDITLMFHPSTLYASDEVRAGRFPLWNPHTFGGAPFFANPQTALLFPLTGLVYVLPQALALTMMSVLKLSIAGVGMYWFLRALTIARSAAIVAAITFAFNALLVTWLQWSYGSAFALLPMLFATTELVRARPGGRPIAALALMVVLALFAGYPQRVVCWLVVLGVWAVYRARTAPQPVRFLGHWTLAVLLGVGLAAVQLVPFAEYLRGSAVLAYRTDWMLYFPLPFRALAAVLMPHFFGSPTGKDFWGPVNFNEFSVSVGVVPWVIMPIATAVAWSHTGTKFFLSVFAVSAAVVYGLPVVGSSLAALPLLNTSIAVRNADLFVFALAVLTGIGLSALTDLKPGARRVAVLAVRVAFTVLIVVGFGFVAAYYPIAAIRSRSVPLWHQYLWLLVLATVATLVIRRLADGSARSSRAWLPLGAVQLAALLPLALTYNPVVDARLLDYRPPPVVKHLQARVADGGRALFSGIGAANLGLMFRLFELGGYDGMTPRYVEQLVDPAGSLESYASGPMRVTLDATSPVLDVLGIRYVVVPPNAPGPAPDLPVDYRGADAVVYANPRAFPRAFVVFRARTCVDDATALALMTDRRIDLRHEVLLADCHDAPLPGTPSGRAEATITASTAERVVVATVTDAPGYLILGDAWFPGWRAWVDGAEHTVWRANHALRAVWVPAGRHVVEFRYVPSSLRWGLLVTLLAGVVVVGLVWAPRWLIGAAAVVLILGAPSVVDAKRDLAPLELDVTPTVATEGERVVISLRPVSAAAGSNTGEPYDLYLSLVSETGTWRGWLFLTSSGRMSADPAPFRSAIAGQSTAPLNAPVAGLVPGWYLVRAQFVKPSATLPARKHYTHQPRWVTIRVDPPQSEGLHAAVVALGAATVAALVVVWMPVRRRDRVPEGLAVHEASHTEQRASR